MRKKEAHIEALFKPDKETGISEWKTREAIIEFDNKLITSNGNFRETREIDGRFYANCWKCHKYDWELKRLNNKPNGKVLEIRMIGYNKISSINKNHPINKDISRQLLDECKNCIHCGNHKGLCIDHKNDMYNDERVLNRLTQTIDDFQVLCNKCNKDLKHQDNVKEEKTGKIHSVKDIGKYRHDNFEYPWEKALKVYNKEERVVYINEYDIHCKMYSYWYDIEEFERKRDIFVMITRPINRYIKRLVFIYFIHLIY